MYPQKRLLFSFFKCFLSYSDTHPKKYVAWTLWVWHEREIKCFSISQLPFIMVLGVYFKYPGVFNSFNLTDFSFSLPYVFTGAQSTFYHVWEGLSSFFLYPDYYYLMLCYNRAVQSDATLQQLTNKGFWTWTELQLLLLLLLLLS